MKRRLVSATAAAGLVLGLALAGTTAATADPNPNAPGTPPAGKSAADIYAAVGADAFAELTNNLVSVYDAQTPAPAHVLASYDAINPVTGAAGEQITSKPGCSVARPNGANAGINTILLNQKSDASTGGDGTSYCVDFVRSSRSKGTAAGEANLTFYAQSRDAVSYAVLGNAYAPTTDRKSTRLNSSHVSESRMPSSA